MLVTRTLKEGPDQGPHAKAYFDLGRYPDLGRGSPVAIRPARTAKSPRISDLMPSIATAGSQRARGAFRTVRQNENSAP